MIEEEGESVEILSSEVALGAQTRGEIDMQIATAKKFPRSIKEFLNDATELVTMDEETAASMWYSLPPRKGGDGKKIEGPSVRMAEVVAFAWKNFRVETNIESIDENFVTAVGSVADIERNNAFRYRVKRRITTKDGRRYSDDMIVNTCNSASSIAFREVVFKAVPRVFVKQLYQLARKTAVGTQATLVERRAAAVTWFKEQGVEPKVLFKKFKRKAIEELTLDDLADLTGLRTAIREGDITVEEAFAEEEAQNSSAELTDKLKKASSESKPKELPVPPQGTLFQGAKEKVAVPSSSEPPIK